jgi:hypothetical protein
VFHVAIPPSPYNEFKEYEGHKFAGMKISARKDRQVERRFVHAAEVDDRVLHDMIEELEQQKDEPETSAAQEKRSSARR